MNINPRYMSADEAVKLIENGDHVYIQGSTSTPEVLCDALARRGHELQDVTLYSAFAVCSREAPYCREEYKEAFDVKSFCIQRSPPMDSRGIWKHDSPLSGRSAGSDA